MTNRRSYWADLANCRVVLRTTSAGAPVCPVCGAISPPGSEAAWHDSGQKTRDGMTIVAPSYGVCPTCHTEYGNDDMPAPSQTLDQRWGVLRERWWEQNGRSPVALAQLRENLGLKV
jgi:hypothetical protein